ncbi:MAG: alpha-glucan family phosphorylase [Verrucomicrobiales bacterium]|nr:alpha-glucan family phosphorylase [Verrucomicrobiales bacterium]
MTSQVPSAAELAELKAGLHRLARNLWWTWNQDAQDLFQELSPRSWQNLYHNAVAVLREVSDYELRVHLMEPEFRQRVREVLACFDGYLKEPNTWAREGAPALSGRPVAYFSAEFGFHETLPIAAGGLGVLAGDHAKAASDLGIGFVGISLFYREGYFQQAIDQHNWQTEYYSNLDPKNLPIEQVLDAKGEPVRSSVRMGFTTVHFQAWRVNVGRVPVYLLDPYVEENEEHYKKLAARVYGGDSTTRIMQEILLGVGGVRLLRALGIEPSVYHMNEGHAAFLILELARERMAEGLPFEQALASVRSECVFTTHTPVEAGHDRFSNELMGFMGQKFVQQLGLTQEQLMALGRVHPSDSHEPFCMTVLALKGSRAANGVSELHGQVSREMWQGLFPGKAVKDVPIGHVTNGVHLPGWMKGTVRRFWYNKYCDWERANGSAQPSAPHIRTADSWERLVNSPEFWSRITDPSVTSDEELWSLRYKLRRQLVEFARRRLLIQGQRISQRDFIEFDQLLSTDALTIGFARRFATYKRAPLIFDQFENVLKLVRDPLRPVQFVFAGKAHPRDDAGKSYIQKVIHLSKHSDLKGHLVFVENYDIHVARQMTSGCDVWLNNPRRPLEASGTSGMKTSTHGCLNLSILDGWWREGWDGVNGFAIGEDSHPTDVAEQDRRDSENLYKVLTEQVIPCFYNRDADGIPRQWIKRMRAAIGKLAPEYTTWRMVQEYVAKYYLTHS